MRDEKKQATQGTSDILKYQNVDMPQAEQVQLGKPLQDSAAIDPKNQEFLGMLVGKIEKKEIDLHRPSSLINTAVYDKLDEISQGKTDYDAVNLLSTIREIYRLWQMNDQQTFQIQNLVHKIRTTKERIEAIAGDIYII